jgi:hypothetical protein
MLVQLGADKEAKSDRGMMPLHHAAVNGHVETVTVLLQLGLDKEAKTAHGSTALHCAAVKGHVEVIKALVEAGAEVESLDVRGETPLQLSVRSGQRQAARELEHTARTRKEAATSERAQQAAEAAERNAAALIEEEKREQAAKAQSKVRSVELVPACGLSDAVSLAHGWEASRSAEGQGQGQGWWWRAVRQGGGCGEQQRRGEHLAWGGLPAQYATINKRCPPHHGGGCSAGCVSLGGGRERCAAACWRRQEGEGTRAQRAAEAAPDGGGEGGAAGSDRGDVRRGVREPSVVDVHRQDPSFPWEVVASMCGWQGALTCGGACGCSGESSLLGAVEKATAEAAKHGDRSEKLAALVAEARVMIEEAKAEQAERARALAEAAAAAAAVEAAAEAEAAAERLRLEEEVAALTRRMQGDALRVRQVHAQLGSSVAPKPHPDETMCVVCFDAPKDHIIVPCYHLCVCEECANQLTQMDEPTCPICRTAILQTNKVFQS